MEHNTTNPNKDYELEIIQLQGSAEFKEFNLEKPHPYRALFLKNATLQQSEVDRRRSATIATPSDHWALRSVQIVDDPTDRHQSKDCTSIQGLDIDLQASSALEMHVKRRKGTNCCQLCVPLVIVILIGAVNILVNNLLKGKQTAGEIVIGNTNGLGIMNSQFPYMVYVNDTDMDLGDQPFRGASSGFLGLMPARSIFNNNGPNQNYNLSDGRLPYFDMLADNKGVNDYVLAIKNLLIQEKKQHPTANNDFHQKTFNVSKIVPYGGVVFSKLDYAKLALEVEILWESQQQFANTNPMRAAVNGILTTLNSVLVAINSTYNLMAYAQPLPYKSVKLNFDFSSFMATALFPFAFSFLLPVFVYSIVFEKQERLREMTKMNGLSMSSYWVINFLYNLVLYAAVTLLIIIIALIFQLPFFKDTGGAVTLAVFLGWGLNQVSKAFLLSTLFSKARTATIICYLLVLFSILAGNVVNNAVWPDTPANTAFFIWPPFAFYRAIFVIGRRCAVGLCVQTVEPGSELAVICAFLYCEAVLFCLLTPYLDVVLPQEYGVRKSPFFIFNFLRKKKKTSYTKLEHRTQFEDSDVAEERKVVEAMSDEECTKYPIVIKNLHKRYDDKVAVEDFCLRLNNGECFGLLGPNGAGKTTTISMLTGLFMPTAGTAYVGGFDIRTEMDNIHQVIGICPQFDILWDTLTVRETILFYCRLKGCRRSDENEMAINTISHVGLQDFQHYLVKDLSGGMKRRLSVAVSLVGNPKIIFLDEPSTGLDPDNRRQLWNVLLHVKQGKCLILTSHSMEEADILCTRIGIVSKGNLRCLGSNVRLKNRFGEGYSLKINFAQEDEELATTAIKEIVPNAVLEESFAGNCTYRIPSAGFVMSELLTKMIQHKEKARIMDWGVTQTTLEDVFLNIVKNDETDSANASK